MDINEKNILNILGHPGLRAHLFELLTSKDFPTFQRADDDCSEALRKLVAPPELLHDLVTEFLPDTKPNRSLLGGLIFNPNLPDQTLRTLLDRDHYTVQLGHRQGPQWLLEEIAEKHGVDEAITTLAISYYADPDYPIEDFKAFLIRHAEVQMMRYPLRLNDDLPIDRRKFAVELFERFEDKLPRGMKSWLEQR